MSQQGLFEGQRAQMTDSLADAIAALNAYLPGHHHASVAFSGGKDSSALVTLLVHLILAGKVPAPKTLTVLYADTRLELLPLWLAAQSIREELDDKRDDLARLGCHLDVRTVMAPLDLRFFVYILGRGVPPPSNTMRWCTPKLKVEPMATELQRLHGESGEKILMLTGVRVGESAARDDRIALACSKDGAECGQGWYQETLPEQLCDTLAPLLRWRVCHVWAWLKHWAPRPEFGDWSTELLADAYGGEEAEENGARTGCVGCPVASEDRALQRVVKMPQWAYLAPLLKLRSYYWDTLRSPLVRLRKPGGETRKDGKLSKNQQRLGPITFAGRLAGLDFVLGVQAEVNAAADRLGRPRIDILNTEEEARIRELIAAETWPEKWTGDEPLGNEEHDLVFPDGSVQPLLFQALAAQPRKL